MKEKVEIKVGNDTLAGVLFTPDKKDSYPAVIFFSGIGGFKERFFDFGEALVKEGYVSFCFDFRGRGESKIHGLPTFADFLEDSVAVLDHVVDLPVVSSNNVTLWATSIGAFMASRLCNRHKEVTRLVLDAPALLKDGWEDTTYTFGDGSKGLLYESPDMVKSKPLSLQELGKFGGDVLVVEHGSDRHVAQWMVKEYFDSLKKASSKKYELLNGMRHAILMEPDTRKVAIETLLAFLKST